jgi:putative peptide zinc metalloprotease protein
MGVTLLVFTPLPFVDTSSAWALRRKRQRIAVGASGMLVELAVASIAGMLWIHTAEGTTLHAMAYNIMFIAGISSLVFNGNPLLRYDAYYILLDLLEIPNLESRSRLYACYLVKRYLWAVRQAHDPSHTRGEKGWLIFYAVASTICRVIVFAGMILFLGQTFFSIGVLAAVVIFTGWVLPPLVNVIRYLGTSHELDRQRMHALLTSATAAVAVLVAVGLIRVPDRCRIEGVVEPKEYSVVHMQTAGFVRNVLDSGSKAGPDGPALIEASSPELETQRVRLRADLRQLQVNRQFAQTREAAQVQFMDEKLAALQEQIERIDQELEGLSLRSPVTGTWVAPDIDRITGRYLPRGQRIGVVANLDTYASAPSPVRTSRAGSSRKPNRWSTSGSKTSRISNWLDGSKRSYPRGRDGCRRPLWAMPREVRPRLMWKIPAAGERLNLFSKFWWFLFSAKPVGCDPARPWS